MSTKAVRQIVIDPVTRIEGHAKITVQLDAHGMVNDAKFHVTQVRGFEKLTQGRPFYEMPSLMARICGICPVSHLLASAKACDQVLAVRIPQPAIKLRRLLNLAQMVQSHALSFFHLSSPDFLLGLDSDPAQRNVIGVLRANPLLATDGIRLRKIGQQAIEILAGKRIHPAWVVPGGVSEALTQERRDQIAAMLPDALEIVQRTLHWFKGTLDSFREEIRTFANFPTMFMALANEQNTLEFYSGVLRMIDADGNVVKDFSGNEYADYIGEAVEPWTYLKSTYYKPMGYPDGIYRVGPLARLNMAHRPGTPLADQEWAEFRELERRIVLSSFYYHYARLIEALYSVEMMQQLLDDPEILSKRVRAHADVNNLEGIGISEAPRGTLIHHYKVREDGLMESANLVIATGHNNLALNRGVLQVAKHFIKGRVLSEGMLNRVEAVVRAYDPCLSCSTHATGQMAMQIQLLDCDGTLLDEIRR
jgi:NAD-reducing hydrogenase large subunit